MSTERIDDLVRRYTENKIEVEEFLRELDREAGTRDSRANTAEEGSLSTTVDRISASIRRISAL